MDDCKPVWSGHPETLARAVLILLRFLSPGSAKTYKYKSFSQCERMDSLYAEDVEGSERV